MIGLRTAEVAKISRENLSELFDFVRVIKLNIITPNGPKSMIVIGAVLKNEKT